jgi:hypothetical protein
MDKHRRLLTKRTRKMIRRRGLYHASGSAGGTIGPALRPVFAGKKDATFCQAIFL